MGSGSKSEKNEVAICGECEQQADDLFAARASVIKFAGFVSVGMIPLVVCLSFADSILQNHPWTLDERILYVILSATMAVAAFAWRSKH